MLEVPLGRRDEVLVYGADYDTREGTCVRDYVHIEDLALAHQLALEATKPDEGHAFNVGNGRGHSVLEVLRACQEVTEGPIPHRIVDRRPGDPATLVANPERLVRELGWQPEHPDLHAMIDSAWRWHNRYPNGYPAPATSTRGGATPGP